MKKPIPKYKLKPLILAAATLSIGLSIAAPSLADRTGVTSRNTEGCQPEITGQKPASGIYQGLEGVVLLIHSPTVSSLKLKGDAYASILNSKNIREVYADSIVKNILPYVRPSGENCSESPLFEVFEYYSDLKNEKRLSEFYNLADNPNILIIKVHLIITNVDHNEDHLLAVFVPHTYRAGFRSMLYPLGIRTIYLNKSPKTILEELEKIRDAKYFLTR